jgi:hypothetical protein
VVRVLDVVGVVVGVAVAVTLGGPAGDAVADGCAASLASSLFTASWVRSCPELPVMPSPSSDTASRLPAVAVAAPISQAMTPKRMRLCMLQRRTRIAKGRLRPV